MPVAGRAWILGALAAVVSLTFSWVPSYWVDEVASVRAARLSPTGLLAFTTTHLDAGHTLYYLALHYWSGVFGFSELATRSLSALGVGVAVALTALIGRRLGRPRLGVLAAALLAVMPRMTWAGTEARSYSWTAALAAAVWLLLLVCLERGGWWWAALGAVAAVSVAAFLLSSTLLAAQLLYVLVRRRRAAVPLVLTWLAALVAASPVLYLAWRERGQLSWIATSGAFTPWTVLSEPWGETSWAYGIAIWLVLAVGALRWRDALRRTCPEWLLLGAAWAGIPLVMAVAVSVTVSPVFTSRYLTFATPGMAMLLAAALASLGMRRITAAAAIALVLIAVPSYAGQRMPYAKPRQSDLRELARTVQEHAQPGDAVVFAPGRGREAIEGYPQYFAGLVDITLKTPFPQSGTLKDKTVPLAKRTAELAGIRAVIVVASGGDAACSDPDAAQTLFQQGFAATARYPTHGEVVCRFVRPAA